MKTTSVNAVTNVYVERRTSYKSSETGVGRDGGCIENPGSAAALCDSRQIFKLKKFNSEEK